MELIPKLKEIDLSRSLPYLTNVNEGSLRDIFGSEAVYYRRLPALIDLLKPKQIVELGSAGGSSTLMMLSHLPKDSHLYACTIPEPEGEFRFIQEEYPQLTLIRGDDLDLKVWGDIDLHKTDIFFFDTDHNYQQVHDELELYDQFFKPGALVFMDDINLNDGMRQAWEEIKYPKQSLPDWHTYLHTGFGVFKT